MENHNTKQTTLFKPSGYPGLAVEIEHSETQEFMNEWLIECNKLLADLYQRHIRAGKVVLDA